LVKIKIIAKFIRFYLTSSPLSAPNAGKDDEIALQKELPVLELMSKIDYDKEYFCRHIIMKRRLNSAFSLV